MQDNTHKNEKNGCQPVSVFLRSSEVVVEVVVVLVVVMKVVVMVVVVGVMVI